MNSHQLLLAVVNLYFREKLEEDDAIAHKVAQDAISGKLRAKQGQRGIRFEDEEDSDEDEDDAARRHKLMRQKRKLGDHDSLDALSMMFLFRIIHS